MQLEFIPCDKKVIYVDMDGTFVDFEKSYNKRKSENPLVGYPQSEYGFFENLEPLEGAVEAVKQLQNCGLYEVFFLTAPSEKNPLCYTEKRNSIAKLCGEKWLERLIISPIKSVYKGHYLIDDHTNKGQPYFEGEHIHFSTEKFPNWKAVLEYLLP